MKPISPKEIVASIRRAATRKSPGINSITSEFYKKLLRPPRNYTEVQRKDFKPEEEPIIKQLKTLYDEVQSTKDLLEE